MKWLLLAVALAPGLAAAQERPSDYLFAAPLQIEGVASHYRFPVPAAAYRGTERRDLGDIRVFNAASEPVPYAFAHREAKPLAAPMHPVKLFPVYGDQAKGLDATTVQVERTAGGTVVNVSVVDGTPANVRALLGYLIDASELKAPQQGLVLTWETHQSFAGQARVEASHDFKSWKILAADAPLLHLEHNGARLERRRIDLRDPQARYFRLSFTGVPDDFVLTGVELELRPELQQPVREWLPLTATEGKARGELHLDTAGHFPVDRLRLQLPQPNTVVQVQIFARERVGEKWRFIASTTAYRLAREGGAEIVSPEITIAPMADRYWMIKVDQKGGGVGAGSVQLDVGWVPHEVVFVARGDPPFRLAFGNRKSKVGALPVAAVLPRQGERHLAQANAASVGEVSGGPQPMASVFSEPGRFVSQLVENPEIKKWVLWGALVIGVLLLAGMALRLLRTLGSG